MNLNKLKIWAVTDGSQGMISQVMGLSKQISSNIKEIKTDLIFPWNILQPGFLPTYKWIFKNKIPTNEKPDIFAFIGLSFIIIGIIILVSLSKMGAKIS